MLKNISYSRSGKHSRDRAQDPGTTLEQLISIRRESGILMEDKNARSRREPPFGSIA
jgi:hypothetical protein